MMQVSGEAIQSTVPVNAVQEDHDNEYAALLQSLKSMFSAVAETQTVLFTTDATGLYEALMENIPAEYRQTHTCNSCRRFIETYGGLVMISDKGDSLSAMWRHAVDVPEFYKPAVRAVERLVNKANVTGVFNSIEKRWGEPKTGEWTHMSITPPKSFLYRETTKTAFQESAEKKQDFLSMCRALVELPLAACEQAVKLLGKDALYRSDKCVDRAVWLRDLHQARDAAPNKRRKDNIVWRAVALAPAGFAHPRTSVIGSLMEDIIEGLPFDDIAKRFAHKMNPNTHMRPQAPPKAGNIAQGEKVIEQMAAAGSLRRRYARLEEVQSIWVPVAPKPAPAAAGVFGHLAPKTSTKKPVVDEVSMPTMTMTWAKFFRTVLPDAAEIEFFAPTSAVNYTALVTAVDADAPPILQWDHEDARNPVSWYVYGGGSIAQNWGLRAGTFVKVNAITFQPSMWGENQMLNQGQSVIFILEGCQDKHNNSLALFPEILKSEFHSIRATIEAHSNSRELEGADEATANGVRMQAGEQLSERNGNLLFRVTGRDGSSVRYKLDRWD